MTGRTLGLGRLTIGDRDRTTDQPAILSQAVLFDLAAMFLALLVVMLVLSTPVGSGDYGQWLMVSRYYSGQDIPDYRQIAALPPLVPVIIAGVQRLFGDPLQAFAAIKVVLALSFFLSTYWTGAGLFRDRSAGLLGATVCFFVTDRLLEPFAFGGLLQLGSLVFLTIAIGAYARGASANGLKMAWWTLGGFCVLLAALSHAGTGVIAILAGCSVAGAAVLINQRLSARQKLIALAPTVGFLALLSPYWLLVILPNNTEYLANTASLYYRGPEALWRRLSAYDMTLVVLYAGVLSMAGIAAWQAARKTWDPSILVAVWGAATLAFLGLTILRGVGTEYPRFMYPMLVPLGLAAGGAIVLFFKSASARWQSGSFEPGLGSLVAVALLLVLIGPGTAGSYRREARAYEMDGLESLIASIDETDRLLDENASILGTVSVGKWVEGISGRNALFYMPNRYIFRSAEQERAFSADIIMRSTLGVTNGQILLRYTQQSDGSPTLPWLAINHRGEYLDLMQIAPFETVITGNGLPNTRLTALTIERFETYSDDFSLGTETTYAGFVGSERVTIVQNLNLSAADATLVAEYEITSASALDLRVLVAPIAGQRTTSVDEFEDGIAVAFVERASASPTISVKPVSSTGKIEVGDPSKGEVIVRNAGAKHLAFAVSFEPETQPFAQKGVFWPEDLIDDYQVGAVYLPDGQSLSARMARMEAHGFDFRSRAGGFILMVKGSPKGSD